MKKTGARARRTAPSIKCTKPGAVAQLPRPLPRRPPRSNARAGTEDGLDATERVTGGGNPVGLHKRLVLQPFERRELIGELLGVEQAHHCRRAARWPRIDCPRRAQTCGNNGHANASSLSPQQAEPHEGQDGHCQRRALPKASPARLRDLVADIGTGRGAETLPAAVRREEDPAPAGKQGPERVEGLVVQHPGRAAVVVEDGRKRTRPDRSVEHPVEAYGRQR